MVYLMADTRVDLVQDLQKKKSGPKRRKLIEQALKGDFHDFKSTRHKVPKLALAIELRKAGYHDLYQNTLDGKYDEDPTRS